MVNYRQPSSHPHPKKMKRNLHPELDILVPELELPLLHLGHKLFDFLVLLIQAPLSLGHLVARLKGLARDVILQLLLHLAANGRPEFLCFSLP